MGPGSPKVRGGADTTRETLHHQVADRVLEYVEHR
jgi:hypothetical protein